MAPARVSNKRKRISDRPAAKRQKTNKEDSSEPSSPRRLTASQESIDQETFYAAKAIIDENKTKYRVDWEPNPHTGKIYEPTWEPKAYVTKDLVEAWKELKKQTPKPGKRNQGARARASSRSSSVAQSNSSTPAEPRESRRRAPRRVIDSSPEVPRVRTRTKVPTESPLFEPQDAPGSTAEPSPAPLNQEHKVGISQPTDFDPDEYSKYSSSAIRASASSPHSSQFITPKPTQTVSGSNATSIFTPNAPTNLSARVIPDTLEVPGSSSFVLSTQQDSASKANGTSQVVPISSISTEESPLRSTIDEISAFESSARVPDSDPEPSSPALPDRSVDPVPESPSQTASSASSSPPPETPEKSQSQSRSEYVTAQQSQRLQEEADGGAVSIETGETEAQLQSKKKSSKAQTPVQEQNAGVNGTGPTLEESLAEPATGAAAHPEPTESHATTTDSSTQESQVDSEEPKGPVAPVDTRRPEADALLGDRTDLVTGGSGEGFGRKGDSIDAVSVLKQRDPDTVRERSGSPEKPVQEHTFSSSPLPPVPSQALDTFASNTPALTQTPSEMATPTKTRSGETPGSTPSNSGFRERSKQMRTTVRARHVAIARAEKENSLPVDTAPAAAGFEDFVSSECATRSPSIVPPNAGHTEIAPKGPEHEEPSRLLTLEDAAAEPVSGPPVIVEPEIVELEEPGQPEASSTRVILDEPPLGPMEYITPLPLEGPQGDQYRRTIAYYKDLVENSARSEWNGEDPPTKEVKHFITRIHNVATHVDLENQDALTQQGVRPESQAEWDQSCSVKFRFLGRFLDLLCKQDIHVVIFARQGRVLDLAETFLRGKHISYHRPDKMGMLEVNGAPGLLSVTLLPTKGEGSTVRPASLLVALDHTLDMRSPHAQSLRSHQADGRLAPVISLVAVNTAEHIKRCLSPEVKSLDRLRTVVICIAQLRLEAGKLPDDYPGPLRAAEELVRYITEKEAEWPLPAIGGFKDLVEFDEPPSQFSVPSSVPAGTQEISGAQKRPMVFEDSEPTKKMRMTPQAPDFINPNDLTRISDSVAAGPSPSQPSQPAQNSSSIAQPPSYPRPGVATSTDNSDLDIENDVPTLRALVISNRNRASDLEAELAALQYRFETLRTEHGSLKRGRDDAVLALATANTKNETQATTIAELKAERTELVQKLEETRKLLEGSSVPDVAQLAALDKEKRTAEERAAKWESRFLALEKERDFFSSTYQTASQAASELRSQNTDLEKSVTDLAKRASGETARLKQLGADQRAKKYEKEVERLKLMVRDLEELVRKKDEDLRAMKGRSGYGLGKVAYRGARA